MRWKNVASGHAATKASQRGPSAGGANVRTRTRCVVGTPRLDCGSRGLHQPLPLRNTRSTRSHRKSASRRRKRGPRPLEVHVVAEARASRSSPSIARLVGIDFPRMEVEDRRLAVDRVDPPHRPARHRGTAAGGSSRRRRPASSHPGAAPWSPAPRGGRDVLRARSAANPARRSDRAGSGRRSSCSDSRPRRCSRTPTGCRRRSRSSARGSRAPAGRRCPRARPSRGGCRPGTCRTPCSVARRCS